VAGGPARGPYAGRSSRSSARPNPWPGRPNRSPGGRAAPANSEVIPSLAGPERLRRDRGRGGVGRPVMIVTGGAVASQRAVGSARTANAQPGNPPSSVAGAGVSPAGSGSPAVPRTHTTASARSWRSSSWSRPPSWSRPAPCQDRRPWRSPAPAVSMSVVVPRARTASMVQAPERDGGLVMVVPPVACPARPDAYGCRVLERACHVPAPCCSRRCAAVAQRGPHCRRLMPSCLPGVTYLTA
jgi:hypothetical protein